MSDDKLENIAHPYSHILPLYQGTFWVDGDKQFTRVTEGAEEVYTGKPALKIGIQPFLIQQGDGSYILLDAGLSCCSLEASTPDIFVLLRQQGISPTAIRTILISHLHRDHFSGLFHPITQQFLFPDAHVYIYQQDVEHCLATRRYPDLEQPLSALLNTATHVHLLTEKEGTITPAIRYAHTGGHMPFHLVFWINDGSKSPLFYGGDEAPQLMQLQRNIIAKYDTDGKKASELRKVWWEQGQREGWTFLFYHDIRTPWFK